MNEKFPYFPNAFYDLIVFASSTFLMAMGVFFGCGLYLSDLFKDLGTINVLLLFVGLVFVGYEYGRIAEALSAVLVQAPLRFLHQRGILLKREEFLAPLEDVEDAVGVTVPKGARPGGKWFVYFYAILVHPAIGTDLLKRYAWEKLSRNSAFTFAILLVTSCLFAIVHAISGSYETVCSTWRFGGWKFTSFAFALVVMTYYEYYRRNCWNNDLLRKVLTVLREAASSSRE